MYVFLAVLGLHGHAGFSLVLESRGYSSCGVQDSHCNGFSCCGAQVLKHKGFRHCGSWAPQLRLLALKHRLDSYGTWP